MQNYEIPREEWPQAVTAFGDEHRRWLVSIDVVGDELGAQPEVRNLPLDGITADPPDKGGLVSIFVERSPDDHLTRNIENARRIRVEEDPVHGDAMQIEGTDGTKTIVTFAPPRQIA